MSTIRSMGRSMRLLVAGSAALGLLGGCGGGEGGGGAATTTTTTTTTAAAAPSGGTLPTVGSIQLTVSSQTLPSSGVSPIDITARILSSSGVVIAGTAVVFTVTDAAPVAFITDVSGGGSTDANGLVTARLNLGTNKANRVITVTATADAVSASVTVTVSGTTVGITGNPTVTFGGTTPLTITVRDSAGNVIQGASVTVTSATGNTLTPASGTTTSLGQLVTTVTGTVAGADTITAAALGSTQPFALTVSSTNFRFTAPAEGAAIPIGAVTPLTVRWEEAGVPVPVGTLVAFRATRGVIVGSPAATNAAGDATVTITSGAAGVATITASDNADGNPAATRNIVFVATTATRVDVQANPSTVAFNVVGSSANAATISAVVRDSDNNLVTNARVNFVITSDPSAGSLSAPSAVTDISGIASVSYIAGTVTCCGGAGAPGAVVITATVVDVGGVAVPALPTDGVTLTVGGQPLFVRLGTNNLLGATTLTYIKSYVALVTDAAGNPVDGATVRFTVRPRQATSATAFAFFKGIRVFCLQDTGLAIGADRPDNPDECGSGPLPGGPFVVTATAWRAVVKVRCLNEDTNFNGILDLPPPAGTAVSPAGFPARGEDSNGDGELTPGNVASVTPVATTDAAGFATAEITYAKQFGDWTTLTLTATATNVTGTEATSSATFVLPVLRSDVDDAADIPPGVTDPVFGQLRSPFGRGIVPATGLDEAQPADGRCTTTD